MATRHQIGPRPDHLDRSRSARRASVNTSFSMGAVRMCRCVRCEIARSETSAEIAQPATPFSSRFCEPGRSFLSNQVDPRVARTSLHRAGVKFGELVRRLERAGFRLVREKGSIRYYGRPGVDRLIRVDYHGSKEVPSGTCRAILKAASLER